MEDSAADSTEVVSLYRRVVALRGDAFLSFVRSLRALMSVDEIALCLGDLSLDHKESLFDALLAVAVRPDLEAVRLRLLTRDLDVSRMLDLLLVAGEVRH